MPPMGRVMGVDVGTVRVGVALSDEQGVIARPHATVPREGERRTAEAIRAIAAENDVERIVVGLPLRMNGTEQPSTLDARAMGEAIRSATGLPVVEWDERLTSAQAERALIEGNVRREKRRLVVDQVAAALMLQSYLDHSPAGSLPAPQAEPPES